MRNAHIEKCSWSDREIGQSIHVSSQFTIRGLHGSSSEGAGYPGPCELPHCERGTCGPGAGGGGCGDCCSCWAGDPGTPPPCPAGGGGVGCGGLGDCGWWGVGCGPEPR